MPKLLQTGHKDDFQWGREDVGNLRDRGFLQLSGEICKDITREGCEGIVCIYIVIPGK